MLDWIISNLDSLFSGAGVVIVVYFFSWIRKKIKSRKSQIYTLEGKTLQDVIDAPPPFKKEPIEISSTISPAKIIENVESSPFLQQSDVMKQYEGISVSWKGTLDSAYKRDEENVRIQLSVMDGNKRSGVFFSVNPDEHPGLGLLRKGHEISVEGKIKEVNDMWIVLDAEKVLFKIDDSE